MKPIKYTLIFIALYILTVLTIAVIGKLQDWWEMNF